MQADQLYNVDLSLDELKDKNDVNSRVKINKRGKVKVSQIFSLNFTTAMLL